MVQQYQVGDQRIPAVPALPAVTAALAGSVQIIRPRWHGNRGRRAPQGIRQGPDSATLFFPASSFVGANMASTGWQRAELVPRKIFSGIMKENMGNNLWQLAKLALRIYSGGRRCR